MQEKLKKLTQHRLFWPLVCAVSVAAGWWYLSITTCAQLGGDDELINLQNTYYVQHHSFWQVLATNLRSIASQFLLQSGRFRPFSSPPEIGWTSYFVGDLVVYRLYILAWTYADILLTGLLVGRASRDKRLGVLTICLLPMMFSLWQDCTGNSLYSYGALAQSTLLPVLLAGLCLLRWQDTGHTRWAVLAAYCAFHACATFEIGFVYIVPLFGLAWLYTDQLRPALRLSVPVFLGELVCFAFNMGARAVNALRAAGVLPGTSTPVSGISPNFDLPLVLRTWLMQMSAAFPLNCMLYARVRPGQIELSDVVCGVLLAGAAVAALAALRELPGRKQNLLLFLTGLAMLSAPALLIGLSPKYQNGVNVDWRHGYIPQTVESFGVGLMALSLLVWLLRRAQQKNWRPALRATLAAVLAVGMAGSVVWQRAASRSAYANGGRAYTVFAEGVAAGLADAAGEDTPVVCDFSVWGGDAQTDFFLRYADTQTDARTLQNWRAETHTDDEAACRLGFAVGESKKYDIAWYGAGADALLETVTDVTVYLPPRADADAVLTWTTRAADGTEQVQTAAVCELPAAPAEDGGTLLTLPGDTPIVGDSICLTPNA